MIKLRRVVWPNTYLRLNVAPARMASSGEFDKVLVIAGKASACDFETATP
jgi:hypothetical protein